MEPETLQENYQTNRHGVEAADTDCQLDKVDEVLLQGSPTNKEMKRHGSTKVVHKPIIKLK